MKDNYSSLFLATSAQFPQTDKADYDKRLPNASLAVASARDTLVLPEVSRRLAYVTHCQSERDSTSVFFIDISWCTISWIIGSLPKDLGGLPICRPMSVSTHPGQQLYVSRGPNAQPKARTS